MNRKVLTTAIAGALAAPMAAQAVDFTISGHVNRALFIVAQDSDHDYGGREGGTKAQVSDNGQSNTRVRVTGSTELEDGNKIGIQVEYGHGTVTTTGGRTAGGLTLRHANVQLTNSTAGRVTIGQGSEAGDASAYSSTSGVFGVGHGVGTSSDFTLGSYFGSLDAGGRVEMIRYDSPALGPVSAAVSVGNGDRLSGLVAFKSEFSGTSVGAKLATLQYPAEKNLDRDRSIIGASAGMTMPSGLTLSGAWAKGKDWTGTGPVAARAAQDQGLRYGCFRNGELDDWERAIPAANGPGTCPNNYNFRWGNDPDSPAVAARAAQKAKWTEASYYQVELGYKFGNSAVAASWYKSSDFVVEDSEGTALGLGVKHTLPKAATELYAAVQKYGVEQPSSAGWTEKDETLFVVGTRVKF